MTATDENGAKGNKAFFVSLEKLAEGESVPLDDVLARIAFNDQGLLPVITQDDETGEVLMFAWMNNQALERTLSTGQMTYFSRSRNALWIKGETSGSFQWVEDMRFDCDGDVLLCRVRQEGSACHTGRKNCFFLKVDSAAEQVTIDSAAWSPSVLRSRTGER
ncbi:MAG: phosphoribosyl-AMP cyclohydrolase [Halioglobus sp.]